MGEERFFQTFGIESCHDLYSKMQREFERLERAICREDIVDHALNFAITAYHGIDWAWAAYEDGRLRFREQAATDSSNWGTERNGLGKFRKYIEEREPRLRVCGLIANSAKHLILEDPKWAEQQSEIETAVSAATTISSSGLPGEQIWVPKIVVDGQRLDARLEFDCILNFWASFIHGETEEDSLAILEAREDR